MTMPNTLLEEQLIFDLSQREGEITSLRQRLADVEAERDVAVKALTAYRSTLQSIGWLIRHQLNQ